MDKKTLDKYNLWSTNKFFDVETRKELLEIKNDEKEISERFYKNLEFGTAGLRGILGAGTNRMNIYTIWLATHAFAKYLSSIDTKDKEKCVVISYDSRHYSELFSLEAALVFATYGIKVYLSDELRPVPMLSYAVRHYGAIGGVMVTASHNPAKYNGYKAYGDDGSQLPVDDASKVYEIMESITDITTLSRISKQEAIDKKMLVYFGKEIDDAYSDMALDLIINKKAIEDNKDMKIIFTPMHGTSNKPVRRVLKEAGFKNVIVVPEQEKPDGDFPTVESPNPEDISALEIAIKLAKKESADLVVATDPDGDRTAIALKDSSGEFVGLSGNQIGLLLMEYILGAKQREGKLSNKSFVVSTVVSTKLTRKIAKHYDIKLFEVLTGFKFIGEIIKKYDEEGDMNFEFGFEESFGYLAGKDVRDKDAVVTIMLACEMAAYARSCNQTLFDKLLELYEKYGFAYEKTVSIFSEGKEGIEKISKAMKALRENKDNKVNNIEFISRSDYLLSQKVDFEKNEISTLDLEKSNVLLYSLGDLDWFCVRPSGTEPKLKIYFGIYGENQNCCKEKFDEITTSIISYVKDLIK